MYNNYLNVNKKFKSSVNLQYDLNNLEKINQYIPTSDLCDVIKNYANNVLNNDCKSTLLAGPYGKGKSYLVLMLTYFFSEHEDRVLFERILNKIKLIDSDLYYLLDEVDKKHIKLLPVVINGNNSDDINQNFLFALKNSLSNCGLDAVVPNTAFTECLELIEKWEKDKDFDLNVLNKCIAKTKVSLKELKIGLQNYDLKAYFKFTELFECVSHGYKFNPLVGNDLGLIFEDVAKKIRKYGYNGIFILFDEFGVFLDNQTNDFGKRLNKIQSFAEKCNSSDVDSQLHFCCVTHKELKLYRKADDSFTDEFEKIEGRFKQYRFDRSLEENYQIICAALEKKNGYKTLINKANKKYELLLNRIKASGVFNTASEVEYVFNNGYPFNPVSLFALINISEKIAQNERTLFTFISDNDNSSFYGFIQRESDGMLGFSVIYDYFEESIHENIEYKDLYYKIETLKRMNCTTDELAICKALAIIKIINDDIKLSSNINSIALGLAMDLDDVNNIVNSLLEKNLLKQSINNGVLDFSIITDNKANDLIESIVIQKYSNIGFSELLNSFNSKLFYVSNKYNFEYKMSRFFRERFFDYKTIMKFNNPSVLFESVQCDGLIVDILNDGNIDIDSIKLLSKKMPNNIIIRYNDAQIKNVFSDSLKKYSAVKYLLNQNKINDSLRNSLQIISDDMLIENRNYIRNYFGSSKCYYQGEKIVSLNEALYSSLINFYTRSVLINNEQINKNSISSVSLKARNEVIDSIIAKDDKDFGLTSAEATVKRSFDISITQDSSIVNVITDWFINNNGKKISASDLVCLLQNAPYGMRKGIIPLYIEKAVSMLSIYGSKSVDTVLLYNNSVEIDLNALNLTKVLNDPSKYYFCYEKLSKDKLVMTKSLSKLFGCNKDMAFSDLVKCIVKTISSKVSNLPSIIVKSSINDNVLELSKEAIEFKDLFIKRDINNYDLLFKLLPSIINCSYADVAKLVTGIFNEYSEKQDRFIRVLTKEIIKQFGIISESIKTTYDLWKGKYSNVDDIIFEPVLKKLHLALKDIQFNDFDSVNAIVYSVTNSSVNDLNSVKYNLVMKYIKEYIDVVSSSTSNAINKKIVLQEDFKISNLGNTLYTNLKDSIEEYGESLTVVEKAAIVNKLLKDIME